MLWEKGYFESAKRELGLIQIPLSRTASVVGRINSMGVNDLMTFVMENGETFAEGFRIIRADAAGKINQAVDGSYAIRDAADSKNRIIGDDAVNNGRDITSTDGT